MFLGGNSLWILSEVQVQGLVLLEPEAAAMSSACHTGTSKGTFSLP